MLYIGNTGARNGLLGCDEGVGDAGVRNGLCSRDEGARNIGARNGLLGCDEGVGDVCWCQEQLPWLRRSSRRCCILGTLELGMAFLAMMREY